MLSLLPKKKLGPISSECFFFQALSGEISTYLGNFKSIDTRKITRYVLVEYRQLGEGGFSNFGECGWNASAERAIHEIFVFENSGRNSKRRQL